MVEEVEEQDRRHIQARQEVEAVAPLTLRLLHTEGNDGGERAGRRCHEIGISVRHIPPLHRDDLGDDPKEGELTG